MIYTASVFHRRVHSILLSTVLAALSCHKPRTQIEVRMATDLTPFVARGTTIDLVYQTPDADAGVRRQFQFFGVGPEGMDRLPASFVVQPLTDHNAVAFLGFAVNSFTSAGYPFGWRRVVNVQFSGQQSIAIDVFFRRRCAYYTMGCTSVPPERCTLATYCEELGQTCGNDGTCVDIEVLNEHAVDGGGPVMDVPTDVPTDGRVLSDAARDSASDVVFADADARVDAAVQDTGPERDYLPVGPQQNVTLARVVAGGWSQCWVKPYAMDLDVPGLMAACTRQRLMVACRRTGNPTIQLLAQAARSDVFFLTETEDVIHEANGTRWYFTPDWSMGFAPLGQATDRYECDVAPGADRLCFHTLPAWTQGYRCGDDRDLDSNGNATHERLFFQRD